ncbi:LysR family transcriptional regulator [Phragmitibacter flavus]|uniref:LysR family transcriptional regulator n=1 Tax=Phragmitibacter flavus TaxID=2576071 RepID=A0A5R8KI23_9BACT|nr:LysR substrate-binding domain-containing protein [Phragmitibacter flavus]TLD71973.1 LysR family transcriptional regulator [Phragmitibacter flavus]
MDYSLRELECFTAVAEELSFTRAARRLNLAQPPLSRHIRTLEEKLGTQLFDRESRTVTITTAGNLFYEETRGILPQLTRAAELARRAAQGETARLRLGFVSAVLNADLVDTFRRFRETHPSTQIILHDIPPSEQLRAIAQGKLDGGFIGLPPNTPSPGIQFITWHKEPLIALVPSGHPLTTHKRLALADLAKENFIAVAASAAPAFSTFVQEKCRKAGFRPRIILESPRAQAVAVMVAAGSGIALLPQSIAHLMGPAVIAIPLKEKPTIAHVFAHRTGKAAQPMQHFLKALG